jgi:signal transduction histidine kinase/CheY-like chemotaxis protein
VKSGIECTVEHRTAGPEGAARIISGRGRVYRDELGNPIRMGGTVMDITRQRQVEEHLREAQKMEAIGQLAGGVAHDFNNILAAILMQAEVGRRRTGIARSEREILDEIVVAAERGAALTKQLLAFARRQVLEPKPVDLGAVVSEHAAMLRRLVGEQVRVQVDLDEAALVSRADVGMIGQVLMNLAVNARDAMPAGGDLTIATAEIRLDAETPMVGSAAPPGSYCALRVTDTGTGIPPEHLRRVFEPFFTTKPVGKGTGLGLATVFGIVKLHGGFIRVSSELGKGTTFEILFRPSDEPVAAPSPMPATAEPPGAATILLVEDDPSVRKTTRMLLEMNGHEVIDARSGADALRAWDEHGAKIGLLFTDVTLPEGMKGQELAAELRKRKSDLKVILTSGYSADLAGRELESGDRFLMKPTPPEALLEAVERTLAHG